MIKILFADDDLKYSMLLKSFLQQQGYDVTYAGNGKKAWEQFPEVKPDLVLLDINMPEMDGYEVAERIRAIDPKVLIFFLTDRTEKNDRLKGFSLKANDYLAKPFYPEELLARIEERFSMNESETIEEEVYHFGETTFCYNNNELRTRSSRVLITSRQADILRLLAKNIGNVVSKEMIQEAVWGTVSYANSLAVNVQMTYLRHALQHDATVKIESLKKRDTYLLSYLKYSKYLFYPNYKKVNPKQRLFLASLSRIFFYLWMKWFILQFLPSSSHRVHPRWSRRGRCLAP